MGRGGEVGPAGWGACWLSLGSRYRPNIWTSSGYFAGVIPAQCWQCGFSWPAQCWGDSGPMPARLVQFRQPDSAQCTRAGPISAMLVQFRQPESAQCIWPCTGPSFIPRSYPEVAKVRLPDPGQVISAGLPASGRYWARQIWLPGKGPVSNLTRR